MRGDRIRPLLPRPDCMKITSHRVGISEGRWEKHTECLMYYLPVAEHMKEKIQVVKFRWHRGDLQRRDSLSLVFGLTSFYFNQRSENRRSANKSRGVANKQARTQFVGKVVRSSPACFILLVPNNQSLQCDVTIPLYHSL